MPDAPAPPPGNGPPVPARQSLDRGALERILRRAGELQASAADPLEEMTEEQLIALGEEVGITPQHLRQAIAEERTRPALVEEPGLAGRWIGPRAVSARRVIAGRRDVLLARLDEYMRHDECLQVKRRYTDRILWEPRRDVFGSIRRGLNLGGRSYSLARAHDVGGTVVELDGGKSLVQLDADLTSSRAARVRAGGATAATGVLAGGAMIGFGVGFAVTLLPFIALAAVPIAAGAGGGLRIIRGFRATAERVQLSLEQALDAIEHPGRPTRAGVAEVIGLLARRS